MNSSEKATLSPASWVIIVSASDVANGIHVSHAYKCQDLISARDLLAGLHSLTDEYGKYLPGLSIEGYQLGEAISPAETINVTPAQREALAVGSSILASVGEWLM